MKTTMFSFISTAIAILLSSNAHSMLCPTNFNTIDIGDSMSKVLQLCGEPNQRTEYKRTISFGAEVYNNESIGNIYGGQNTYYAGSSDYSSGTKSVTERIIIITKFTYGNPQPTVLTFEDGILKDRELLH